MLPRFLAETIDARAASARLGADEARHLSQVLRLSAGAEIAVFDGAGREFRARVDRVARDGADVRLIAEVAAAPEPRVRITLAQAVLKGEKMDDVIRDATMMGVSAIEPLITEHTAAHLKPGAAPDRWRRIAVASAKQCGRAVVPTIGPGVRLADWLVSDHAALKILLTEPSTGVAGKRGLSPFPEGPTTVLVGPEGGWSADEIQAAIGAGCVPVTLGRRTLRADAVSIVALGVLQYVWGDL